MKAYHRYPVIGLFLWLPMARYEHLPLYKKAMDTAVSVETVVKGFSRYHKYTLGTDLRTQSRESVRLVIRANSQTDKSAALQLLRDSIEDLKVTIHLCKEVKAFSNFNTFQSLVEAVTDMSRQCANSRCLKQRLDKKCKPRKKSFSRPSFPKSLIGNPVFQSSCNLSGYPPLKRLLLASRV